jgi:hypothetical protein
MISQNAVVTDGGKQEMIRQKVELQSLLVLLETVKLSALLVVNLHKSNHKH